MNYKCSRCLASFDDLCLCQFQGTTLPVMASSMYRNTRNKRVRLVGRYENETIINYEQQGLPGYTYKRIRNITRLFHDETINNRTAATYTTKGG